jgi:hypothetical protein
MKPDKEAPSPQAKAVDVQATARRILAEAEARGRTDQLDASVFAAIREGLAMRRAAR